MWAPFVFLMNDNLGMGSQSMITHVAFAAKGRQCTYQGPSFVKSFGPGGKPFIFIAAFRHVD